MAQVTLRLIIDPSTGRKDIVISYESDADALPMEHEDEHRALVEKLIEGGALQAEQLGRIIIERAEGSEVIEVEDQRDGRANPEALKSGE